MRTVSIVTYDICDDRRLRDVYKAMRGFGDHIQYSVFRCELSARARVEMISRLEGLIDHREDQVLIRGSGPHHRPRSLGWSGGLVYLFGRQGLHASPPPCDNHIGIENLNPRTAVDDAPAL
jgi:CRISPR-associated protein Cas2